jgi:hypothetical protein
MKKILIISSVLALCFLLAAIYLITSSPRYALREYILALKNKDYRKAYSYLTTESKETISLADFVVMNEKQMTLMDENKTWIYYQEVMVGMQIYEDPGWWGYLLVKHKGKWKIVMKGGIPSFPFAYDCCCK